MQLPVERMFQAEVEGRSLLTYLENIKKFGKSGMD